MKGASCAVVVIVAVSALPLAALGGVRAVEDDAARERSLVALTFRAWLASFCPGELDQKGLTVGGPSEQHVVAVWPENSIANVLDHTCDWSVTSSGRIA